MGQLIVAIVVNLIGGLIFFRAGQFIPASQSLAAQWEVKENITCIDCGRIIRRYRLVRSGDMTRSLITSQNSGAKTAHAKKRRSSREKV
jgi:hypothetical protein